MHVTYISHISNQQALYWVRFPIRLDTGCFSTQALNTEAPAVSPRPKHSYTIDIIISLLLLLGQHITSSTTLDYWILEEGKKGWADDTSIVMRDLVMQKDIPLTDFRSSIAAPPALCTIDIIVSLLLYWANVTCTSTTLLTIEIMEEGNETEGLHRFRRQMPAIAPNSHRPWCISLNSLLIIIQCYET